MNSLDKELIEKLKTATEGSRELDALIECERRRFAAYASGLSDEQRAKWSVTVQNRVTDGSVTYDPYVFTKVIEAAIELVPDGFRRRMMINEDGRASCQIWPIIGAVPEPWGQLYASEPIAICIAALEAQELIW